MLKRLVLVCALVALGWLAFSNEASACGRRHREHCCNVCCEPCCKCICEGWYWDCCSCRWIRVIAICCCDCNDCYPHWACCEVVWPFCGCACIWVEHCWPLGNAPEEIYKKVPNLRGGGGGPSPTEPRPGGTSAIDANSATIVVHLPAEATLMVDDQPTTSTSDRRVFVSPALTPGMDYGYVLTAKLTREGKVSTISQRVAVRAGETREVSLQLPAKGVASK